MNTVLWDESETWTQYIIKYEYIINKLIWNVNKIKWDESKYEHTTTIQSR